MLILSDAHLSDFSMPRPPDLRVNIGHLAYSDGIPIDLKLLVAKVLASLIVAYFQKDRANVMPIILSLVACTPVARRSIVGVSLSLARHREQGYIIVEPQPRSRG